MSKQWITGQEAALRCRVNHRIIAMMGVAGRLKRIQTGKSKHRPLFVYEVETLEAWIVEYREEHGIEPPPGTTRRECLKCLRWFDSEGSHNRRCPVCLEAASNSKARTDDDWNYAASWDEPAVAASTSAL